MYLIFQQSDFDNIVSRIFQELTDANILLQFYQHIKILIKVAVILETTFWKTFFIFLFTCHRSLFLGVQLTVIIGSANVILANYPWYSFYWLSLTDMTMGFCGMWLLFHALT